jgi:hypothetical protein
MGKIPGFVLGAKSFPPYEETDETGTLSFKDTYFGTRESGGLTVISHNETPILISQYHGGEPQHVPDEEVGQVNDFLKGTLRDCQGARSPTPGLHTVLHDDRHYGYLGYGEGDIWTLDWIEIIYRFVEADENILEIARGPKIGQSLRELIAQPPEWLLFYHFLAHQRIR